VYAEAARRKLDEVIESYVAAALGVDAPLHDVKNDSPVMRTVRAAVRKAREGHDDELVALIVRIFTHVEDGLVLTDAVSPEDAKRTIDGLVELGVLDWKVEELAQQRAEELTRAFREEHGLPVPPVAA
jgi:hypothetical protein